MYRKRGFLSIAFAALTLFTLSLAISRTAAADEDEVTVFAAASLKNALDAVIAEWQRASGKKAKVSYAASSALARQIEQGAPADLFISADLDWMDYVADRKAIRADTRLNLLGNKLALIAPKDSKIALDIKPGFDLSGALGDGKLAMAAVETVPAGKYGKAALEKLGVWSGVAPKVAQAENVRAALLLVSRGEAPLGIVYQTDAVSDPKVKIVATFPADTHPAILYPAALTLNAGPAAESLFAFIKSPKAKPLFEEQGFTVIR